MKLLLKQRKKSATVCLFRVRENLAKEASKSKNKVSP
jgi:hypothetical protein